MVSFDRVDLDFILKQIQMAEAGQQPINPHLAFGLREVAGTNNNLIPQVAPGANTIGAADQSFLNLGDPIFQLAQLVPGSVPAVFPPGFVPPAGTQTSFAPANAFVVDAAPRTISNLIADQTSNNPAAVQAFVAAGLGIEVLTGTVTVLHFKNADGTTGAAVPAGTILPIPNITPDGGISAPFNTWMTLFGQFFDHGLDLITKNAAEVVFIPLQPDDPLFSTAPGANNFMLLSRATVTNGKTTNTITPFVDQSQTYTSHPSHQAFLRDYITGADGLLHSTGQMLSGTGLNTKEPTWADIKANALKFGILLTDADVGNVPLLATDAFGNLQLAANGFAQVVVAHAGGTTVLVAGMAGGLDLTNTLPLEAGEKVVRTGHAFINDMAAGAKPAVDATGHVIATSYNPALLNSHFVAGDGRINENIGLTAVHEVFHDEHNRLVAETKATIQAALDKGDTSLGSDWVLPSVDLSVLTAADLGAGRTHHLITAAEWNGERLFQAAKFGTETQYQHLVFEEFARKVSPNIHLFGNTNIHLDPAITSEFANSVYRFGHSMLTENLNIFQLNPDGTPTLDANGNPLNTPMGLITAFTNPAGYAAAGAASIIAGAQAQVGNEIDEFVTGTLRNNLLGLPLDLAALNIARGRDTGVPTFNLFRNQMYEATNHDANLKPYESWTDFGLHLKHAASLVNFVAAYGNHATIAAATTVIAKRAAAQLLIDHAQIGSVGFDQDAYDFLHSTGAYANVANAADGTHTGDLRLLHEASGAVAHWSTGSVTGLDTVDMWIAGLAEKQNLNGDLLGNTFDFIFRTQMENLQDADRLYYLPRVEGTHWSDVIENNTFTDLIQRNTGNHHLMASVFQTAEYTIESKDFISSVDADGTVHYNPNATFPTFTDATGAHPLVEVKNDGSLHFIGKDQFFGNTMVLGGTANNDHLVAGNADDDTVWGDAGNDTIDGGGGNDQLFGGDGNDLVTDDSGNNIMHGDAGDDTVIAGKGDDLLFGGDGNDTLYGNGGVDVLQGGRGNDVMYGGEGADELIGGQGDDWLEGGKDGGDTTVGDGGAPTGQVPLYSGNDVMIVGQGSKMQGFSGDDIMLGTGGNDVFWGGLGFDWASFERETAGVSINMNRREFISPLGAIAGDGTRDIFPLTEAASGSKFGDNIVGNNVNKVLAGKNELTNAHLIVGLQDGGVNDFFGAAPVNFSGGNILLGGAGNDTITGGLGNDIIEGDAWLHVELENSATGTQIARKILYDTTANNVDTAVFAGAQASYTLLDQAGNALSIAAGLAAEALNPGTVKDAQGFWIIRDNVGTDGTDRLRHIERLQFTDGTVDISGKNALPSGVITLADATNPIATPAVGDVLSATDTIADADGIVGPITYQWQYFNLLRAQWVDIVGEKNPASFIPTDFEVGRTIRLNATYTDGKGFLESVASAPTAILTANALINHGPTVTPQVGQIGVPEMTAYQGETINYFIPITNFFTDDHTASGALSYAATLAGGASLVSVGLVFTPVIVGGVVTGATLSGTLPANFNGALNIQVSATDNLTGVTGPGQQVYTSTSTFELNVLNVTGAGATPDMLGGPAGPGVVTTAAAPVATAPTGLGVNYDRVDLDWILRNIKMAEAGQPPVNPHLPFGLREVAASNNNATGHPAFGTSDQTFPRLSTPILGLADTNPRTGGLTTYSQVTGSVFDSDPRTISNLISDQSANNPAALAAALSQATVMPAVQDPNKVISFDNNSVSLNIKNVTPDGGISAPYNTWMTLFGQFFDHGLDLVNKGGNGKVIIPLLADDPLFVPGGQSNFMVLTRASMVRGAGADGIVGTADDTFTHESTNAVTPVIDQSQTYSSHPAHQVFLREYIRSADGTIHSTGGLLSHTNAAAAGTIVGQAAGAADGSSHMATWGDMKANALTNLGLRLSDYDVVSVPLVLADAYGNVIRGANGFAQVTYQVLQTVVTRDSAGAIISSVTTVATETTAEGTAAGLDIDHIPVPGAFVGGTVGLVTTSFVTQYVGAGAAFINDMAHNASPFNDFGQPLNPDGDGIAGNAITVNPLTGQNTAYDGELLNSHYVAGDGRVNENIGLTAIHDVLHSEHARLVAITKAQVQAQLDKGDTSFASEWVLPGTVLTPGTAIAANQWNGERLFQAARFGTETQYQHLVFEEFARKVAPDVHVFSGGDIHLDPSVFAEFAHTVYRFGHSMLDDTISRVNLTTGQQVAQLNSSGQAIVNTNPFIDSFTHHETTSATSIDPATGLPVANVANPTFGKPTELGLLQAFTNPLAYLNQGADAAGQLALGSTSQVGQEIDEFVTGTLRNNLLGLPLDLPALNIARGRSEGVAGFNLVRNELYQQTHEAYLKPYENWHEMGQFLKHPESLVNFIAAYGTHASIVNATTLVAKRAAALALVTHGDVSPTALGFDPDAFNYIHSLGAYANNAADPRAVHTPLLNADGTAQVDTAGHALLDPVTPKYSTGSVTGLDAIDLWIGGLAEKQNLHGGLLGSTFDYIFKLQMEQLQDADRLYYLPRIEGMHFSDQIEDNSFATMIQNATGAHHLSGSIFLTPEYKIEAKDFYLKDGLGNVILDANGNPTLNPTATIPTFTDAAGVVHNLVEYKNDGTVHFVGKDNFFGNTMVLGGTAGNDKLQAGQADDDTVWGDAGNDTIDGGGGNDFLYGGDGNDVLSNANSSVGTSFHGDAGNDTIYGGKGDDLIFGGAGDDVLYANQHGPLGDAIVAGAGNDILYGGDGGASLEGNQGDDWLEGGKNGGDALVGDGGAPTGELPLYSGDDVMIANGDSFMKGFGGDDIMLGRGGFDKFLGGLGFDWASFERETEGVFIDMNRRDLVSPTNPFGADGIRDLFTHTEGASGSKFDDDILGNNNNKAVIIAGKDQMDNPNLIKGLADGAVDANGDPILTTINGTTEGAFFKPGQATGFAAGDILLGGAGNDTITGGKGDDIIDGKAYLHVELLKNSAGVIGSGSQILREIRYDTGTVDINGVLHTGIDTAVFTGNLADYGLSAPDAEGFISVTDSIVNRDGVDRIRNIERLQFADVTISIGGNNQAPVGFDLVNNLIAPMITIDNDNNAATAPVVQVGTALTANAANLLDPDFLASGGIIPNLDGTFTPGVASNALGYQWQYFDVALRGWVSINEANGNGATTATFTPIHFVQGNTLRAEVSYTDALGFREHVFSAATTVVNADPNALNTAPFIVAARDTVGLPNTATEAGKLATIFLPLTSVFNDTESGAGGLTYTAFLEDGVTPLDGSAAAHGLTFTVQSVGGVVTGGTLTGTPTTAGAVNIMIKATDPAGLHGGQSVTNVFTLDVLATGNQTGLVTISGVFAVGNTLTALVTDADGLTGVVPTFQWQTSPDGVHWTSLAGATASTLTVTTAFDGLQLHVLANYIDNNGHAEALTSTASSLFGSILRGTAAAEFFTGTINANTAILGHGGSDDVFNALGGIDTVQYPSANAGILVDLREIDRSDQASAFSAIDITTGNLAHETIGQLLTAAGLDAHTLTGYAEGADINMDALISVENVLAGHGDDVVFGNDKANVIEGSFGNDTIDGGAGVDTAVFTGNRADYDIVSVFGGSFKITDHAAGRDGIDRFRNIELLKFADGLISTPLPLNIAPVIAASTGTITTLEDSTVTGTVPLGTDANEDPLTYAVVGVKPAGLTLNADGTFTYIPPANLNGDISFNYQASDGAGGMSGLVHYTIHVTPVDDAPTGEVSVAVTNNVAHGRPVGLKLTASQNIVDVDGIPVAPAPGAKWQQSTDGTTWTDLATTGGGPLDLLVNNTTTVQTNRLLRADASYTDLGGNGGLTHTFNELTSGNYIVGRDANLGDTLGTNVTVAATMMGLTGNDTYVINNAGDVVVENLNQGTDTVESNIRAYTLAANVENLTFTGVALAAGAGVEFTGTGNALSNILIGGAGDDVLDGIGGGDDLRGGLGNDTYVVHTTTDIVRELAGEGTDTVRTDLNTYNLRANLENLTYTGALAFSGTGNGLANIITSGNGADVLIGGQGADTIDASGGNDTVFAGFNDGDDVYHGGLGVDTYDLSRTGAGATVNLALGTASSAQTGSDLLDGFENVIGTTNADRMTGNSAVNILKGGAGNDTFLAAAPVAGVANDGNDTINGDAGNDTYDISATSAGAIMTLTNLSTGFARGTDIGNDTLNFIENLTGSKGADIMTGNALANILKGGQGDDILAGGAGNDSFVFDALAGHDTIRDFAAGRGVGDVIDLNRNDFGVNSFNQLLNGHLTASVVNGVDHTLVHFFDNTANSVTIDLVGVRLATMAADDFRFH